MRVLEAREQQIRQLLRDRSIIKFRIKEIADETAMKCNGEDMTKAMFFASVLDFARKVMVNLKFYHAELAAKPAQ